LAQVLPHRNCRIFSDPMLTFGNAFSEKKSVPTQHCSPAPSSGIITYT
jgi:hypothetical protein